MYYWVIILIMVYCIFLAYLLPLSAAVCSLLCISFIFPSLPPLSWIDKAMSMNRLPPTALRGCDQSSESESESLITSMPMERLQGKTMVQVEKPLLARRTNLTKCLSLKTSQIMCKCNFRERLYRLCVTKSSKTVLMFDSRDFIRICESGVKTKSNVMWGRFICADWKSVQFEENCMTVKTSVWRPSFKCDVRYIVELYNMWRLSCED